MLGCDMLYTPATALVVKTEVAARMGGVCPCMAGEPCPLLRLGGQSPAPKLEKVDHPVEGDALVG